MKNTLEDPSSFWKLFRCCSVFDQLCTKFDKEFVLLLAYQNINQGLWAMVLLAA